MNTWTIQDINRGLCVSGNADRSHPDRSQYVELYTHEILELFQLLEAQKASETTKKKKKYGPWTRHFGGEMPEEVKGKTIKFRYLGHDDVYTTSNPDSYAWDDDDTNWPIRWYKILNT